MFKKIKQKLKKYWKWFLLTICGVGIALAAPTLPDTVQEAFAKSELQDKYELIADRIVIKTAHIDDAKVEISTLEPQATFSKWDNEVDIKIKPKGAEKKKPDFDGEKIKFKESKKEHHFYEVENGYEIETILLEKPTSNVVEYEIETKGLDFFYQPELTQQEIDGGAFRPENVIGSYAVYHSTKQGDYSKMDGKNYRAGKAFHIYRPKIIDANGAEVWGNLVLDVGKKVLTVEISQEFLNNAVYPVVVDPTLGYETLGSSAYSPSTNEMWGGSFIASASGTLAWMKIGATDNSANVKGIITDTSYIILANGITNGVALPTSKDWTEQTNFATAPSVVDETQYVLFAVFSTGSAFYYDAGSVSYGGRDYTNSYASPINPTDLATIYRKKYSIYATYTATAAGTNMQINISDAWKDVELMKINIGDVWKDVEGVQINIGDSWKTIY